MKRAKIYIGERAVAENRYNIYRFKNEPAQKDLDYYTNVDPITTIYEEDDRKDIEYGEIGDYVPFIDDKGEEYEFITYSAPFDFMFKQDFVIFHIGGNKGKIKADKIVEVYTSKVAASRFVYKEYKNGRFETVLELTDVNEIKKHFIIESPSCVALHKSYTENYTDVRLGIHTRRLFYIDQESHGVYKPVYKEIERLKDYELHPVQDTQCNIYHYTAIGTTKEEKVTEVSNVASVLLAEDPNKVNTIVECSDDYCEGGDTWQILEEIKASNAYRIKKDDMYTRNVPKLNINEIKADDSNIQIYHERILKIPNIWHRDKMNLLYRKARAYRFVNEYNGVRSDYSDVFFKEDLSKVNIDKMVIYKKRVTYLPEEERKIPIEIGDPNAELLKICVRVGGLYYKDAISKIDYQPIEIFSDNSRKPIISIKDRCFYSNHYNYTVYLYDEKGKQSEPYCVVL